jgi:hypothetical protein
MATAKITFGRRSFVKNTFLAGGGLILGFSRFSAFNINAEQVLNMTDEWFKINAFLKIGENGMVTIMSAILNSGKALKHLCQWSLLKNSMWTGKML